MFLRRRNFWITSFLSRNSRTTRATNRAPARRGAPVVGEPWVAMMAVGRGLGEQADLVIVDVEAVDLEVLGRGLLLVPDVDGHVGIQLDLRDLPALAVVEVGGDARRDADVHAADILAVRGQGQ